MRSLTIISHVSLDGVIQHSPDGTDFPYGDWTVPYRTPEGRDLVTAAHGETLDLVLGRRTYDLFSGFWPTAPSSPLTDRLNAATKYVATHRPESLEWGPSKGVGPDLADGISLIVYPVLLGTGKRLFADGTPAQSFHLTSTSPTTPTGLRLDTYTPTGPLKPA